MARALEIDAVIDPAQTRAWLTQGLMSVKSGVPDRSPIDSW
jgi:acetyl-CoA carboxylase carboxyltransferase component